MKLATKLSIILTLFSFSTSSIRAVNIGEAFKIGEGASAGVGQQAQFQSLGAFITAILPNVFVVANLIMFFFILLGGFTMISSSGNPEKQKEGSKILVSAIAGFAIIFCAYWIMNALNIITGATILKGI